MVLTPEILRDVLGRKVLPVSAFSLVVLDECHHAISDHPMALLCKLILASESQPRILGLTASPVSKRGSIAEKVSALELSTGCKLAIAIQDLEELYASTPVPDTYLLRFTPPPCTLWSNTVGPDAGLFDGREYGGGGGGGVKRKRCVLDEHITPHHSICPSKSMTTAISIPFIMYSAYLRARHSYYIHSFMILAKTLRTTISSIAQLDRLQLPVSTSFREGYPLLEHQQTLFQVYFYYALSLTLILLTRHIYFCV
jgi:hypothetical protein